MCVVAFFLTGLHCRYDIYRLLDWGGWRKSVGCVRQSCSTPRRCGGSTPLLFLVRVLGTSSIGVVGVSCWWQQCCRPPAIRFA